MALFRRKFFAQPLGQSKTLLLLGVPILIALGIGITLFNQREISCANVSCKKQNDPWFAEKYNPDVPYFFTYDNAGELKKHLKPHMQKSTFSKQVNYISKKAKPLLNYRSSSCSVVGSSGNLRNSGYGTLIDSHETVIRINDAPTKKFENDVGSKTTMVFTMAPRPRLYEGNPIYVRVIGMGGGAIQDTKWYIRKFITFITNDGNRRFGAKRAKRNSLYNNYVFLDPRFAMYAQTHWYHALDVLSHDHPSTGYIGLLFALHTCETINVFGFGADKDGVWDHYFPPYKPRSARLARHHDPTYQEKFLDLLAETGYITLYRGSR